MKEENAIEVRNVRKTFKVFLDRGHTMKEFLLFKNRRRYENRVVLDNITFSVKKGEAVGLVGHNGCGKSTTLKLLTRIIYPDSGEIEMRGRVSSLIELGAGFHPDMSGRENIYINASIFGLTKQEIDRRLDDIIRFSELEDYIDNPVRTYSSGMYMRLAFSVAINVDADILLIDEILAVGDANFQDKCFNKMREIKASGTTIVLVSHSLGQIEQICDRSIWINDGKIVMEDIPKDVHLEYLDYMNGEKRIRSEKERKEAKAKREAEEERLRKEEEKRKKDEEELKRWEKERSKQRFGNQHAHFDLVEFFDSKGKDVRIIDTEEPCSLYLKYSVSEKVPDAVFGYALYRADGVWCHGTNTHIDRLDEFELHEDGSYRVKFERLGLVPGKYWFDVTIETWPGIPVDYYKKAIEFEVISKIQDVGVARIQHEWFI